MEKFLIRFGRYGFRTNDWTSGPLLRLLFTLRFAFGPLLRLPAGAFSRRVACLSPRICGVPQAGATAFRRKKGGSRSAVGPCVRLGKLCLDSYDRSFLLDAGRN